MLVSCSFFVVKVWPKKWFQKRLHNTLTSHKNIAFPHVCEVFMYKSFIFIKFYSYFNFFFQNLLMLKLVNEYTIIVFSWHTCRYFSSKWQNAHHFDSPLSSLHIYLFSLLLRSPQDRFQIYCNQKPYYNLRPGDYICHL